MSRFKWYRRLMGGCWAEYDWAYMGNLRDCGFSTKWRKIPKNELERWAKNWPTEDYT